ncbi:MAG: extracellular solute-binding protein [Clostridia bacterium]|nr:extracellular solute-binding protein [Clostridia bacterium]
MKKSTILAFLLALATILGACGGPVATTPATVPGTAPATSPATADTGRYEGLGKQDFDGREFIIAGANEACFQYAENGSVIQQAYYEAYMNVEEELNCVITIATDAGDIYQAAQPSLMAGDYYADVFAPAFFWSGYFIENSYAEDLNQFVQLQLDQPWWEDAATEMSTFNGKTYAIKGALNPSIDRHWVVFFNKAMIENLGLTSPYEHVRNNTWTWDTFETYMRKATFDVDGDNYMSADDSYGWGGPFSDSAFVMWMSAGQPVFEVAEDGTSARLAMGDAKSGDIARRIRSMMFDSGYVYDLKDGESWVVSFEEQFPNDRCLFTFEHLEYANYTYWVEMTSDFGIVPVPKYDANQEKYSTYLDHYPSVLLIPRGLENPEDSAVLLEALAQECYRTTYPNIVDNYKDNLFRDEESAEMLDLILDDTGRYFELSTLFGWSSGGVYGAGVVLLANVCIFNGADFSAEYEQNAEATQLAADELLAKLNNLS